MFFQNTNLSHTFLQLQCDGILSFKIVIYYLISVCLSSYHLSLTIHRIIATKFLIMNMTTKWDSRSFSLSFKLVCMPEILAMKV